MKTRWTAAALIAIALAVVAPSRAEPAAPHSAACVAALKTRAEPLAQRVRRGETAAEAQLLPVVRASFAFIGTVYKQGLDKAQADELMRRAESSQAKLPPAEATRLQDACQAEGQQLLAQANPFERGLVERAAESRIEKLRKAS
jgi:hypothetical protein